MPHKQVLFRSEAREKVLRGATAIADAVRVTLGPRSKCVLIEKKWGAPIVCNDGVTIAKEFTSKDPDENLGAQMLRGAAERTGDAVGDGTTTSTLLAHAIVAHGMRNIAAGASAIDLKRGLDKAAHVVVESLRGQSRPVQSLREKEQVATVSAHNDASIGELVAGAIREKLEERLAKLPGGVAVIRVGAPAEAEMKSRREAFDDAIHATRAAIAEGVVPGAGLALLRAIPAVEAEAARLEEGERAGALILRRALEAPTRQIAENSGVDGGVVVEKMASASGTVGFDAAARKYVDLVEAGIIDPTKVVRLALENAVSAAGVLLLTEATMTEAPEPKAQESSSLEAA